MNESKEQYGIMGWILTLHPKGEEVMVNAGFSIDLPVSICITKTSRRNLVFSDREAIVVAHFAK